MMGSLKRSQQGITLIVALIFLVVLTLLGVGSIQDTVLEEKMAASLRFKDIAFQEAEAVLREAEDYLDQPLLDDFSNTSGRYNELFSGFSDFEEGASWGAPSWVQVTWDDNIQSAYVIQEIPVLGLEDSKEVGVAKDTRKYYVITARAVGVNTSAQVVLQENYSR